MSAQSSPGSVARLSHLDGLRTVAILWVAVYHYAYFWTSAGKGDDLLPYDAALARFPLADVGFLGVYLFFIVSGFVIAMSLTRSLTIGQFALNRAIRLWPTLIICATLTFLATSLLGPPALQRSPLEYLISLTFVPPAHVGKALGLGEMAWLDGAYWSLWTEVRFYLLAAWLYFSARSHFLLLWTAFAFASTALHVAGVVYGGPLDALGRALFTEHQPYFTAGIALASMQFGRVGWARWLLTFAIMQAFAYPALTPDGLSTKVTAGIIIVFVFAIPVLLSKGPIPILSSRLFVTVGVGSYAYYLLHQNAGIALLTMAQGQSPFLAILTMLAIQVAIVAVSVLLTTKIEAPLRRALRARFRRDVSEAKPA